MTGSAHAIPFSAGTPELREYQSAIREGRATSYTFLRLLGIAKPDPVGLVREVERGLPYRAFERLERSSGLSAQELAVVADIPMRTLHRRRAQGRLDRGESDRLVRFGRVFGRTLELFEGDVDAARQWLARPLPALADHRPIDLARTDVGTREVELLIGRLEHGVVS
jgi:putative toxin-antitoxin system antitoxin component (TIGR02293 family)